MVDSPSLPEADAVFAIKPEGIADPVGGACADRRTSSCCSVVHLHIPHAVTISAMASEARKGLAALSARDAAPRFQSLCASTFSALQERIRLGHEVAMSTEGSEHAFLRTFPYFARDKTIAKNLHTLMDALDAWNATHANGDLLQSDDVPTLEQITDWTATVHRLVHLLGETNNELNDPRGTEMLNELRIAYVIV